MALVHSTRTGGWYTSLVADVSGMIYCAGAFNQDR